MATGEGAAALAVSCVLAALFVTFWIRRKRALRLARQATQAARPIDAVNALPKVESQNGDAATLRLKPADPSDALASSVEAAASGADVELIARNNSGPGADARPDALVCQPANRSQRVRSTKTNEKPPATPAQTTVISENSQTSRTADAAGWNDADLDFIEARAVRRQNRCGAVRPVDETNGAITDADAASDERDVERSTSPIGSSEDSASLKDTPAPQRGLFDESETVGEQTTSHHLRTQKQHGSRHQRTVGQTKLVDDTANDPGLLAHFQACSEPCTPGAGRVQSPSIGLLNGMAAKEQQAGSFTAPIRNDTNPPDDEPDELAIGPTPDRSDLTFVEPHEALQLDVVSQLDADFLSEHSDASDVEISAPSGTELDFDLLDALPDNVFLFDDPDEADTPLYEVDIGGAALGEYDKASRMATQIIQNTVLDEDTLWPILLEIFLESPWPRTRQSVEAILNGGAGCETLALAADIQRIWLAHSEFAQCVPTSSTSHLSWHFSEAACANLSWPRAARLAESWTAYPDIAEIEHVLETLYERWCSSGALMRAFPSFQLYLGYAAGDLNGTLSEWPEFSFEMDDALEDPFDKIDSNEYWSETRSALFEYGITRPLTSGTYRPYLIPIREDIDE